MDRDKKASLLKTRALPSGSKGNPRFNSTELIMLGPKQSDKSTGKALSAPPLDRKRTGSPGPAKKPKLAGPSGQPSTAGLQKFAPVVKRDLMGGGARRDSWETKVINVEPELLMAKFAAAEKDGDEDRMQGVLCGAVKLLRSQRPKPDAVLYLSLMFLAKTRPQAFQNDTVIEAFCHLLRKETPPSPALKGKGASAVAILAANLLLAVFQDSDQWPDAFVRAFVEDSLGDRLWVDHEECKCFVDNILTAFKTRMPPKSMMAPELTFKSEACPSPPAASGAIATDDDDSLSSLHLDLKETTMSLSVVPRYSVQEERIEKYILDIIQEQLQRRQPTDISRNVLRLMVCTCGLSAVRALVAHRLETWLSNPKLTRPAQDLLLTTCMNCNQHNKHDQDVIEYLVRIRLKTKPVINNFLQCVRELLGLHPDNLPSMLRRTIFNELSQSRNPNNMGLISVILQHSPERAARVLAEIFQDLLASREDYLRALRALFREIIRSLRHELNFHSFCAGLMVERKEPHVTGLEQPLKERLLMQVADLITLATFMAVTPAVKECATALYRNEKKDMIPLYHFQQQISAIQCDVVGWMYMVVMRMYRPNYQDFMHVLRKCLFLLDQPEHYCRDNWPPEQERGLYLRISSEMPVMEDTLLRILFIGMSKEHPATQTDAVELVDVLIRRAGLVPGGGCIEGGVGRPVLQVEQLELFDIVFSLCAYHQPENYALPEGYTPPSLAIADYYWRAFIMMLVVIAHNPSTCGRKAWTEYPTLRAMMHMCITNQFVFPPSGEQSEEMHNTETRIAIREKQLILEFETHLAAASTKMVITEQNSLLLSKLIKMDPTGPARRPPPPVLEQLKALNDKLRLGQLLCRSRNPNYLLEIIRDRQEGGSSQAMPWLADLVENSESSLDMLPVQCLCEFLLSDTLEGSTEAQRQRMMPNKRRKLQQLMGHLHRLLRNPESDCNAAREVIEYFMKRLTSQHMGPRGLAVRALQLLLCPANNGANGVPGGQQEGGDFDWLLEQIPQLPHFNYLLEQVIYTLRQAIHIETDPLAVVAYVAFLSLHTPEEQQADVCLDLAHLLVERATIMNAILPLDNSTTFVYGDLFLVSLLDLFIAYLNLARRSPHTAWQDEFVQVEWSSGERAQMHILVVHSMIIALTYGPPRERPERFTQLLRMWFPPDGVTIQAFLAGTRDEALLLPDWLKLRMIRSPVEQLVDAALRDLSADQLVLFIQSFGIPVASMSKLLQRLDRAVELDPHSMSNAMLDKSYMSQLVEVQHRRGAIGGDRYKALLAVDKELEHMETDSAKPTSVIQIVPRNNWTRTAQSETMFQSVTDAIVQIYRLEPNQPSINSKVEQDLYSRLQKLFAEDIGKKSVVGGAVAEFILTCERILENPQTGQLFAAQLQSKAAMSCSLFKLVITALRSETSNSPLRFKLTCVCNKLLELAVSNANTGVHPTPLLEILKQQVYTKSTERRSHSKGHASHRPDQRRQEELQRETPASVDEMVESLTAIAVNQPDRLEEALCTLVQRAIRSGDSSRLCQAVTQILSDERLSSKNADQVNTSFALVDWFEQLEPECVWSDKAAQLKLLFEKYNNEGSASSRFRLYLLSTLIHRAHWNTLLECIAMLLTRPIDKSLDASTVLDFLSACMFIPKIWQGRDKKLPKHHTVENVLALSTDEMCAVADFMLEEMLNQGDDDKAKEIVSQRMHIIEHSCVKQAHITFLADHLVTLVNENSPQSASAKVLLVKLYLSMPSVIFSADSVNYLLSDINPQKGGYTRVDCLSHSILIAMSVCDTDKTFKSDLRYLNLSCRKLAATHPDLLLRQLPLIASLLHSRMSAGIPMFGTKNNRKSFLVCIMGVLELLRQKLFNQEYIADVNTILRVYLESMLLHVNAGMTRAVEDNIGGNLNRLLGLVNTYVKHNPDAAREFLNEHQEQLEELARTYKNMVSLRTLLKGGAFIPEEKSASGGTTTPAIIVDSALPDDSINKIPLNLADRDATIQGLQKLEMSASRRPAILELYQDELQSLLSTGDSQLCKQAFRLMLLCIEQRPAAAGRFVSCYLQCLASETRDVVNMALEKLPEFVVLCEEHAPLLLNKAFQLGISSNVNSVEPISDALELLNMQYGN